LECRPMSDPKLEIPGDPEFINTVKRKSGLLFWLGLLLAIVGIVALVFPVVSTLVSALVIGWMLILSGFVLLFTSFQIHGAGPFFGTLLFSLLSLVAGVWLVANPGVGVLALTIVLAILFIVNGASEIFFAFELRPASGWWWMLLSAAISILLGFMVASGLPGTSLFVLGILVGVNFLSSGIALMFMSRQVKGAIVEPEADATPRPGL
jgi:uncharacterized membrane protein HdeD (DUF308 family)